MKRFIKISLFTLAGLGIFSDAAAQDGGGLSVGKKGEFSAKPKLADAVKLPVNPVPENITVDKPVIKYETSPNLLAQPVYKKTLLAPKYSSAVEPLNRMYVKLGAGNYGNLYSEIFYNSLRNRNKALTIHGKHHSGNGPVDNSRFSENLVDVNGKLVRKTLVMDGGIGFRRDANRFYGLIPDSLLTPADVEKQRFNDFHLGAGFGNDAAPDDKFRFNTRLNFYNYSDLYGAKENVLSVVAKGIEPFGDNRIIFDGSYDLMRFSFNDISNNRNLLRLNVHYRFIANRIRITAGFNTAQNQKFHFYPDIRAEADVAEQFLTVFGLLTGDMHRNTFRSFTRENPWLVSNPDLRNTNEKLTLGGGAKGGFSNSTSFLASVNYKNFSDLYFYVNDSLDARRFVVAYDSGTTTLLNFHVEFGLNILKDFNLSTHLDFNKYSVSNLEEPFHRPAFQWTLLARYNLNNKLVIGGDVFMLGKRYGKILGQENITELKPVFDLNAHIMYTFTNLRGLKAYIELNNIAGQKYFRYNYYQARGFQVSGGLIWSFLDEKYRM